MWLVPATVLVVVLFGCERPEIVAPVRGNFVAPSETGVGLELTDGAFRVNGETLSNRINLSTERFVFLFVFVKAKGLYIVSAEKTANSVIAGEFAGPRLVFEVSGTRIEFEGNQGHLLADQVDRSAWVEYLPDYDLLGPDAKPNNAVVGLVARKNLIPGFFDQG